MIDLAVVLVETSLPENLGAVARVLANFGLRDLRLVAPEVDPADPRAVAAATHGAEVLEGARRFSSVAEAVADRRRVWATTARVHERPLPVAHPRAAAPALRAPGAAVLFGPERTGLRLEHLAAIEGVIQIPTDPSCPALNLAQAVTVVVWEAVTADVAPPSGPSPAPVARFDAWYQSLLAELDGVGFYSDPRRRVRALANLRASLVRAGFTEAELRTLAGVVRALRGRRL